MYVRKVDNQIIHLRVSGMLWDYSLVMQDEESGSYWSHILGDCTEGQHKGKSLEMIPSVLTGFANWTREHPDTTVMDWPSFQDQNWNSGTYEVLSHDKFAIGLVGDHETSHFVFSDLLEHPVVNFEFEGQPLVLRFNPETGAGWCFHRELDSQRLSFKLENKAWIDNETGSVWSVSGIAPIRPPSRQEVETCCFHCHPDQCLEYFSPPIPFAGRLIFPTTKRTWKTAMMRHCQPRKTRQVNLTSHTHDGARKASER